MAEGAANCRYSSWTMLNAPEGFFRNVLGGGLAPENVFCSPEVRQTIKTAFISIGQVWSSRWGTLWWDLKTKPHSNKLSFGIPVFLRGVVAVCASVGKQLASSRRDGAQAWKLSSQSPACINCDSCPLITASRPKCLKIRVFWGVPGEEAMTCGGAQGRKPISSPPCSHRMLAQKGSSLCKEA